MTLLHRSIEENPNTYHIELGAGCGNFGMLFFPACFLSDLASNEYLRRNCGNGSSYIDRIQCSADSIPCQDNRFGKIILANPFSYGFSDSSQAEGLFHEFFRVLKPGGQAIIIANKSNPFGAFGSIEDQLQRIPDASSMFSISGTEIDPAVEYPNYLFLNSNLRTPVRPNQKTILTCLKSTT